MRADGDLAISLVAAAGGEIVGHVAFSPMSAAFRALALAPLAVAPEWRRQGVGAALVTHGLELARAGGWQGVLVLGDPSYYHRFGFEARLAAGFASRYAGPHFMALLLQDESPPAMAGRLEHAPAFRLIR